MTTAKWILYNILELKFVQGQRVRDVARRLAMSESDLYRKQRVAIENVAQTISYMERESALEDTPAQPVGDENLAPEGEAAADRPDVNIRAKEQRRLNPVRNVGVDSWKVEEGLRMNIRNQQLSITSKPGLELHLGLQPLRRRSCVVARSKLLSGMKATFVRRMTAAR